jgi:tripartite-type tricarboxylate transporter receptor subunit TctC
MVASNPFFLLANPGLAAKTLPELIALAKAEPGKLLAATDGQRNFSGMLTAWFNKRAGTSIVQVPYATMPQGAQDALAGRVQLVVLAVPSAAALMEQGQLRALGVSSLKRLPGFESTPSISETLPGFDFIGWFAVVVPTGTPAEVIQRMNHEVDAALKDVEIARRMRDVGMYTEGGGTPQQAAAYVRTQLEQWGKIIQEIGLQPE